MPGEAQADANERQQRRPQPHELQEERWRVVDVSLPGDEPSQAGGAEEPRDPLELRVAEAEEDPAQVLHARELLAHLTLPADVVAAQEARGEVVLSQGLAGDAGAVAGADPAGGGAGRPGARSPGR